MKKELLYRELGKYYDLIYSEKDYKKESEKIKSLIKKYNESSGKDLLEVACGTGRYLKYLKNSFSCTGVDLNNGVLNVARKNVKGVKFKRANMVTLNLNKKFDVILCLFSSIGYVKTYSNLKKTISNFVKHLKVGGVIIIEPWFAKAQYKVGHPHISCYKGDDVCIARLNVSKAKDDVSILDFNYLIAEKNKGIKFFIDRHELGMFDINKMLNIMNYFGLKTELLKNDVLWQNNRNLLVGVKRGI